MQKSSGFIPNLQYSWDKTSPDYHAHISRIERTPSVVTDVPRQLQYPNVHRAFKNNYTPREEQPPESKNSSQKKVQLNDQAEIVESNISNEKAEVEEESIDVKAGGFIQKKLKGFELCKWKTFKIQ